MIDMKARTLVTLVLAFAHITGHAIPLVKPGCDDTSYERGFRDLVHKVGIMDSDERVETSVLVNRGVLTKAEEQRIRATFGNIECPIYRWDPVKKKDVYHRHSVASAAIVHDKQTIITAAHVFFDSESKEPIQYLSKCKFRNREIPAVVTSLNLKDGMLSGAGAKLKVPGRMVFGTLDPFAEPNRDRAAIRLAAPVANAEPFEYDSSDAYPTEKPNALINISIPQVDMAAAKRSSDPHYEYTGVIGQRCSNRDTYPGLPRVTPVMKVDCDSFGGGSGSVLLTRAANPEQGPLKAVGIVISGTDSPELRGKPFNRDNHFTRALAINSLFADEIRIAAGRSGVQTADVSQ